jgi:ABC-2 type transport system ATP-binding protein
MPSPLLHAEALTKDYGNFRALDSLNLSIPQGEIFGLLGPNGSGKSTAIRLALGFLRPTAGHVRIAGFDSWTDSLAVRQRVAYLPGELRLYENMTGRQVIGFLANIRGETASADVDRLAKQLDIAIDRPLTQMSSGMKRKVALLAVLTPKVPLVILDEPTNTLDPTMRDQLLEQLRLARDRGQTVLFSSHVLAEVERVCDRVGILKLGKLVHLQPMEELRREGRFVRARFNQRPASGPDGQPLTADSIQPDGLLEFNHRGPLPELLNWLNRHEVKDVRLEPLGLAPIYRRLHGNLE